MDVAPRIWPVGREENDRLISAEDQCVRAEEELSMLARRRILMRYSFRECRFGQEKAAEKLKKRRCLL